MGTHIVEEELTKGWPLIKQNKRLFITVSIIGIFLGGLGTHLYYDRKSDIDDGIIKTRNDTITTLKDSNEKLEKQLKNQMIALEEVRQKKPALTQQEEKPKEATESKKHKTLYDYFQNDFGLLAVRSSVKLSKPNSNETTTIEYKLNMDTVSNSKFISYYVPLFPSSIKTYENILALINAHVVAFDYVGKKYTIDSHSPGDSSYDYSKNLKFSGKIYIYHAGELTLEQKGEVSRQYKGKGLVLQLRDQDYATMQNLSKAKKDS